MFLFEGWLLACCKKPWLVKGRIKEKSVRIVLMEDSCWSAYGRIDSRQISVCQEFCVGRTGGTSELPWDGPVQGVEGEGEGMERKNHFISHCPCLSCIVL